MPETTHTTQITRKTLEKFAAWLSETERDKATAKKYLRDVNEFLVWRGENDKGGLNRERVLAWREYLSESGLKPASVNGKIAGVNALARFLGREECRASALKNQRRAFREPERELTEKEFHRLVNTARELGKERLALTMETLCAAGLRVSEAAFVTVEALRTGELTVNNKGKIRQVLLPEKLCKKLREYAEKNGITSGAIFLTRTGRPVGRRQIWAEMKALCELAGVTPSKVFPHNLRHLFAVAFYRICKDIVKLADVLGHSSIDTTRIYLQTSAAEHRRILDKMRLLL